MSVLKKGAEGTRDVPTADAGPIKNKTAAVKTAAVFSLVRGNLEERINPFRRDV